MANAQNCWNQMKKFSSKITSLTLRDNVRNIYSLGL